MKSIRERSRRALACFALVLLGAGSAQAGIVVTGGDGITTTGGNGVSYVGTSGISATGVDGFLAFGPNGITAPFTNGITATGVDGAAYTGPNGITATGVDSVTAAHADGITATGVDGLSILASDGQTYQADGITATGVDGITATGVDGITATGVDGLNVANPNNLLVASANGITATGVDGITATGVDGITATGVDGSVFSIPAGAVTITGVSGITATGVDTVSMVGADVFNVLDLVSLPPTGTVGLQSVDPELALLLDRITDDSTVNAVVLYHQMPTAAEFTALTLLGVLGGTRFRELPAVVITATRSQVVQISHRPAVRSIYGVRTLETLLHRSRPAAGVDRVPLDAELTADNGGLPVTGRDVRVAVIDTGLNGLHGDLVGRVAQNVKLADLLSLPIGFNFPINLENLPNTDLVNGHGTFVGGVIAGSGAHSAGKYRGVAPGASLVGLSAGDLNLFHVLAAFDYLLDRGPSLNVRVVNCSFSANTVFDANDPVNVATRMLADRGVTVVFSAGNDGPGWNTLNPYAVAPWVIGVGATDPGGRLAPFSSRGAFGNSLFRPKLVAPGVNMVSLRSSPALSVLGALGIESGADLQNLSLLELPFYTTASGTSFSAPMVAGAVALMLEANPNLTPAEIRDILQRTATPLPPYFQHEVGAGMLNAHAAVLEAAFPTRGLGSFRATLARGQVAFVQDPAQTFSRTSTPGAPDVAPLTIPQDAVRASLAVAWGSVLSTNDLALALEDPTGARRATSNTINIAGLTGRRECVTVDRPQAGSWRGVVTNTLGGLGTPQVYSGALEVSRVQYAPLSDLGSVGAALRGDIQTAIRTLVMFPYGGRFRPGFAVKRVELAEALVLAGRAPQYAAGLPRHPDAAEPSARLFVESVQAAPGGPFFPDAAAGASFGPYQAATRLAAAIALVRAVGLREAADARAGEALAVADAAAIPSAWRGYVALSLERGLLGTHGANFDPQTALTRGELAHAVAVSLGLVAPPAKQTAGIFAAGPGAWFLRDSNTSGPADTTFTYGPSGSSLVPISGDWNGDRAVTPGLYDPGTGGFFLKDSNAAGPADHAFTFGPGGAGLVPVAGDWNGDGVDSIGLYDPATGGVFLKQTLSGGAADATYSFGPGGVGWRPLSGDWDANGADSVGLYDPEAGVFYLRNASSSGPADYTFSFGPGGAVMVPISGDWNGDASTTVGVYDPANGVFYLKDAHVPGEASTAFSYGPAGVRPLAGNWTGQ